jgi:hypothetical protein
MSDEQAIIAEYRGLLTSTEQQSQSEFDKAVLALSGGGLGISFTFLKDFIGMANAVHFCVLIAAWSCWALSSTSILFSFYTSILAQRRAIKQLDKGTIGMERPGGWWDFATNTLNLGGLLLFVSGLVLMVIFLSCNLRNK